MSPDVISVFQRAKPAPNRVEITPLENHDTQQQRLMPGGEPFPQFVGFPSLKHKSEKPDQWTIVVGTSGRFLLLVIPSPSTAARMTAPVIARSQYGSMCK